MRSYLTFLILNAMDAVFTAIAVESGLATEANPVMGSLIVWHFWAFVIYKLIFITALAGFAWFFHHIRWVRYALWGLVGSYAIIVVRDLVFALHLL